MISKYKKSNEIVLSSLLLCHFGGHGHGFQKGTHILKVLVALFVNCFAALGGYLASQKSFCDTCTLSPWPF